MPSSKKTLLIIDSNSIIHRAYHALPPLVTKKGEQTGAIYGSLLTLFKVIKEIKPNFIVACFDIPGPTFRHKKFKDYKAKRPKLPKELSEQIPKTKEILKLFNIPIFEKEGFEADDLIATITKKAKKRQIYPVRGQGVSVKTQRKQTSNGVYPSLEIYILSGDLDILQLVSNNTKVYTLQKGIKKTIIYDRQEILSRFGIEPAQIVDFKALCGDPSDNIPGVTGIGKKTATKLLLEFASLENLYKNLEENSEKAKNLNQKLRELLLKYKEQAFFSKSLALAKDDVSIDFKLDPCQWKNFDKKQISEIFEKYEFYSLIKRLPEIYSLKNPVSVSQQRLIFP